MRGTLCSSLLMSSALLVACDPVVAPSDDVAPIDGGAADADPSVCADDDACSDDAFCNGRERCRPGASGADERGCLAAIDVTPCLAGQSCEEASDACVTECSATRDADGDGAESADCGGTDCDDSRADVSPDRDEVCDADGTDEDCDPTTIGDRDLDGDGANDALCCNDDETVTGGVRCGTDCDDLDPSRRPGATEICNDHDDDCNGASDEGVQVDGFLDEDRDRHGAEDAPVRACPGDPLLAPSDDDCDDTDPAVHEGQIEICDGRDNDCDELIDEDARSLTWYRDEDGDGFGSAASGTLVTCVPPMGHSLLGTDCDDGDRTISPIARETCNGRDDDCNGIADYRIGSSDFEDDDGDGHADRRCPFVGDDCNDRDPFTHPGAAEVCDLRDNDCDEAIDDGATDQDWRADDDHDGFGDDGDTVSSCAVIAGRTLRGGDCDDGEADVHPDALDACGAGEGRDDDCDLRIDEAGARFAFYLDGDGDGFGAGTPVLACSGSAGRVALGGDCDDASTMRSPSVAELCGDGSDQDCDGATDCADGSCAAVPACGTGGGLSVTRGDDQTATVTHPLDEPVELTLTDTEGRAVRNATITVAGPANAFWYPQSARTDAAGRARFSMYLGRSAGLYRFTFAAEGLPAVTVDATALAAVDGDATRPVDAADTGERPSAFPAASVGVSLDDVVGAGVLSDGRLLVADRALRCVLQVSLAGIATPLVGRCVLSGMGGGGSPSCTPAGDGGPAANATLCGLDVMLLDEPRDRLYLLDLARAELRRVNLATGRIDLLSAGASPLDASSDDVPIADVELRAPFLPATIDHEGRIHFAQSVEPGGAPPLEIYVYDPALGAVSADVIFNGDPNPDPIYMPGGFTAYDHVEPMARLFGEVRGALRFEGERCTPGKSGSYYTIGIVDEESGVRVSAPCDGALGMASEGLVGSTVLPGRLTATGLDASGSPVYAVDGPTGPEVYRLDRLAREVARVPYDGTATVVDVRAGPSGELLLGTGETVVEVWGIEPLTGTAVTAAGSTSLSVMATEEVLAEVRTVPGFREIGAVGLTPGGGSYPARTVSGPDGTGQLSLVAGWTAGTYAYDVGALDVFGVVDGGVRFTVTATPPPAGTLVTLMGYPAYTSPGEPRDRPEDDGAAVTLDVLDVTGVAVASDGTTYVGVANIDAEGSLYAVSPQGDAERLDRPGGFPTEGPVTAMSFNRVEGLALDEATDSLYVADGTTPGGGEPFRIWRLDLTTMNVELWAGDDFGSYADGTHRLSAALESGGPLSLGPDGTLYFGARTASSSRPALRYIEPATGLLRTLVPTATSAGACGAMSLWSCSRTSCAIAFPATGDPVIVAHFCGTDPGCGATSIDGAVARRSSSGALTHVAGDCGGDTRVGGDPRMTRLIYPGGAMFRTPDDLIIGTHAVGFEATYVWNIPLDGGTTTAIAGDGIGAYPFSPRSGPALTTSVYQPRAFARRPDGRLVFADGYSVRTVW